MIRNSGASQVVPRSVLRLGPCTLRGGAGPKFHAPAPKRTLILDLLEANGVKGAVVEWYGGAVGKLSGPSLLRVAFLTNPTHYVQRLFTAALGMPIATEEREADDAQGRSRCSSTRTRNIQQLARDTTVDPELAIGGELEHRPTASLRVEHVW